jgi:aminoglycoside phosphotransferase (APT) family kinase protein
MPPAVKAVLDWELATLGEPMADLGLFLFYWREPAAPTSASCLPGSRWPALRPR